MTRLLLLARACLLGLMCAPAALTAAPPTGLMTDLIEHLTDHIAYGTPQQKADAAARLLSGSYLLMLEERTDRLALAKCA